MANILIFAGTTEGRKLAEAAAAGQSSTHRFWVSVATEHGRRLLPKDSRAPHSAGPAIEPG